LLWTNVLADFEKEQITQHIYTLSFTHGLRDTSSQLTAAEATAACYTPKTIHKHRLQSEQYLQAG
jgi:hypothetical protein